MIRVIGLKHGARIIGLVLSGIVIGGVVGFGIDAFMTIGNLNAIIAEAASEAGVDPAEVGSATDAFPVGSILIDMATWAVGVGRRGVRRGVVAPALIPDPGTDRRRAV